MSYVVWIHVSMTGRQRRHRPTFTSRDRETQKIFQRETHFAFGHPASLPISTSMFSSARSARQSASASVISAWNGSPCNRSRK